MNFRKVSKIIITSLLIIIPKSLAFNSPIPNKKLFINEAKRVKYSEDLYDTYEEPTVKFKYLYKPKTEINENVVFSIHINCSCSLSTQIFQSNIIKVRCLGPT